MQWDERTKKWVAIGAFVVFTIFIGWALYFTFFRVPDELTFPPTISQDQLQIPQLPQVPPSVTEEVPPPETISPPAEVTEPPLTAVPPTQLPTPIATGRETQLGVVTNRFLTNSIPAHQGIAAYDPLSGNFVRVETDGKISALSDKKFFGVTNINWGPNGNQAILGFADGSNLYFDFTRNIGIRLPDEIREPSFNQNGTSIAFKWIDPRDPNRNYIGVGRPDGGGLRFVEHIGRKSRITQIKWSPDERFVATVHDPYNPNAQQIFFIGQNQERFGSVIVPGLSARYIYTPNSKLMLASTIDMERDGNHVLQIISVESGNTGTVLTTGLKTTVEKCVITPDSTTAFCAVPRNLPRGAGAVPELAVGVFDDFYQLDLKDGKAKVLALPVIDGTQNVIGTNLSLARDGTELWFTNSVDGRLLSIRLK